MVGSPVLHWNTVSVDGWMSVHQSPMRQGKKLLHGATHQVFSPSSRRFHQAFCQNSGHMTCVFVSVSHVTTCKVARYHGGAILASLHSDSTWLSHSNEGDPSPPSPYFSTGMGIGLLPEQRISWLGLWWSVSWVRGECQAVLNSPEYFASNREVHFTSWHREDFFFQLWGEHFYCGKIYVT